MKVRLMGTAKQNNDFIQLLKKMPEVNIYSISKPYQNRNSTTLERVYLELEINQTWQNAEVVDSIHIDYPGIFPYQ